MTYYDVIVTVNGGEMPRQRFLSFHSASRCFRMYVCDAGIHDVAIINSDGLELAKWINV